MNDSIIVRTEKDYKVSKWSGGDTTELYLYPENGDYRSGNFQLRISSATVEADRSEFTSLPGVDRYLMIFQGHLDMIHGEKEKVSLEPDFNLMLKNGARGRMEALCLEAGQEWKVTPEKDENFLAVYVSEGAVLIEDIVLGVHELGVIKKWDTKAGNRVVAHKRSRLGICRAKL